LAGRRFEWRCGHGLVLGEAVVSSQFGGVNDVQSFAAGGLIEFKIRGDERTWLRTHTRRCLKHMLGTRQMERIVGAKTVAFR